MSPKPTQDRNRPVNQIMEIVEMTATEAWRRFGQVMSAARQNQVVRITRRGKPVVYVVPTWLYQEWVSAETRDVDGEQSQDIP